MTAFRFIHRSCSAVGMNVTRYLRPCRGCAPCQTRPRLAHSLALAVAVVLMLSAAAPKAMAHQYWLAPSRYDARPGQVIEVGAIAGTGFRGERKPWSPNRCVRFVGRMARTIDLSRGAAFGDLVWTRLAPSDARGGMLAYESNFTQIELPAPEFDAYLKEEGLVGPLSTRQRSGTQASGRERYRRCAKTWLAGSDPARAMQPIGLPLEVVPLALPGRDAALRVRVLWGGRPLAAALVKAWRAAFDSSGAPADGEKRDSVGVSWEAHADRNGEVTVPVAQAGEWLVSVVHMVPCAERDQADWESTWASLTFARLAAPRGSR